MKTGVVRRDGKEIKYTIKKQSKKNIILRILEDGRVMMSIPARASYVSGERLISGNFNKIYEKSVQRVEEEREKKKLKTFKYLGKEIQKTDVTDPELFLMKKSEKVFNRIARDCMKLTGLSPSKVRVKKLKSAWGICYSNKSITLNLKLIQTEEKIIEYVIIHELCHLKHMNHSSDFWSLVESFLPDYKLRKAELKRLQRCGNYFL